jgi:hypothetical protein
MRYPCKLRDTSHFQSRWHFIRRDEKCQAVVKLFLTFLSFWSNLQHSPITAWIERRNGLQALWTTSIGPPYVRGEDARRLCL